jgi:hypothetical protein
MQEVARRLGRVAPTISRALRRNAATRSGGLEYRLTTAQWHAERAARRASCHPSALLGVRAVILFNALRPFGFTRPTILRTSAGRRAFFAPPLDALGRSCAMRRALRQFGRIAPRAEREEYRDRFCVKWTK